MLEKSITQGEEENIVKTKYRKIESHSLRESKTIKNNGVEKIVKNDDEAAMPSRIKNAIINNKLNQYCTDCGGGDSKIKHFRVY